ncbi:hypothetical protein [Synechococcus sp. CCY 9618]|uniref:hypothetical protein n=1 Tax=Synechococcus sp. CCY 9618 TaxID=2815602 RepID=UPI001C225351|nr:hypothetical protein [Synechococcus sp. CCY 9618]
MGRNVQKGADGIPERGGKVFQADPLGSPGHGSTVPQGASVLSGRVVIGRRLVDEAVAEECGVSRRDDHIVIGLNLKKKTMNLIDVIGEEDGTLNIGKVTPHQGEELLSVADLSEIFGNFTPADADVTTLEEILCKHPTARAYAPDVGHWSGPAGKVGDQLIRARQENWMDPSAP